MSKLIHQRLRLTILLASAFSSLQSYSQNETFSKRVVAVNFNSAWEVVYGPHDSLWVTENKDYLVQRVDIASGTKTLLLNIKTSDATYTIPSTGTQPQGGLMGMALHPALYSSDPVVRAAKPWVYLVFVYKRGTCPGTNTSCVFTTKIVRYTYSGNALINPFIVLDNLPGSSDHNSGRLIIGPTIEPGADAAHTQYRLYYTLGDMGAGRALNSTRVQNALKKDAYEGKVIRLNTEDDGDAGADAWVPNDNPFYNASSITPQDYVYTYGHRNAQGLVWGKVGSTNMLYNCEHMDKTDDEINLIQAGQNYGWDSIAGNCDGNVNGYQIGQTVNPNEQNYCSSHVVVAPMFTLFTATPAEVATMPANNALWPTVAPSSIDFYGYGRIPNWNNSLLLTPLKKDVVYRFALNNAGTAIISDTIPYFRGDGDRLRRVTIAPDGVRFYVARDKGASLNTGSIIEYTYTGAVLSWHNKPDLPHLPAVSNVEVYPNPVRQQLQIQMPRTLARPFDLLIYDATGIMKMHEKIGNYRLNLNVGILPAGVYTLKLYGANHLLLRVQKIVKVN